MQPNLTHLRQLEAESIHIIREVAASFERPVMLYSIGKDSSVCCIWRARHFTRPRPLPVDACRHHLEIPRNDRISRPDSRRIWL